MVTFLQKLTKLFNIKLIPDLNFEIPGQDFETAKIAMGLILSHESYDTLS